MTDQRHHRDFTPPPFSTALAGHLMVGILKAAAIALLLWVLGLAGMTAAPSVGTAITTAALVMIAVELATTCAERPFVLRHRHPDPGSIPMTVIVAMLPVPISLLVGVLTTSTRAGVLLTMAVTVIVYWIALVTLERPWANGDSQADIRRKYEQTRAMTREQFPRG